MGILIRPLIGFKFTLGLRIILAYSCNSIILVWLAIELNMLRFLPILSSSSYNSLENSLKYFLIQSPGSIIFLFSSLIGNGRLIIEIIVYTSILLKLGSAPFQGWFLSLVIRLNLEIYFLLATLQKLIPLIILSLIISKEILLWLILLNLLRITVLSKYSIKLIKLMGIRRLNGLNWILARSLVNINLIKIFFFFCIYFILLLNIRLLVSGYGEIRMLKFNNILFIEIIILFFFLFCL